MNLSAIRADNLKDKFLKYIKEKYLYLDQDILNKCCQNRIYPLPLKYNLFRRFYQRTYLLEESDFSKQELREAQEKPVILHYAEGLKPWDNLKGNGSDIWWHYAKMALPEKIFMKCQQHAVESTEVNDWCSIIDRVSSYQEVVIFGYSHYGKEILQILCRFGLKNIAVFCDNNPEKHGSIWNGIEVKNLEEIKEQYPDAFIINTSQRQEQAVYKNLLEAGYQEENIWHYSPKAFIKNKLYYSILDPKYYLTELRSIVTKECGVILEDWVSLCSFVKKEENNFLTERYYMREWALTSHNGEYLT